MSNREKRAKDQRLREVYDSLPKIECSGACHTACGPVFMSSRELERAIDRRGGILKSMDSSLDCPFLRDGRCLVYDIRPLLCRFYGVVEGMECAHGCVPEKVLPRPEAEALIRHVGPLDMGNFMAAPPAVRKLIMEASGRTLAKMRARSAPARPQIWTPTGMR